jgi:hypothetical protein
MSACVAITVRCSPVVACSLTLASASSCRIITAGIPADDCRILSKACWTSRS